MTTLSQATGKYWAIFRIELRQLTAYTWDFIIANITVVLFFFILLQVWQVTVRPEHVAALAGERMRWTELIWFLAGAQILFFSVHSEAQLEIEHDVISGNIVVTLARPYDYLLARLATVMANILLSFCVVFPAAFLMAWGVSGEVTVSPFGIAIFLVAFVLRSLLYFTLQAIAGLATFWLEKATAFVWILGLLILTFGGGAVPLGFWPLWARRLVELTPFPVMMYYPAKLLVQPDAESIAAFALRMLIWSAILCGVTFAIYRRALRRLDINGG